MQHNFRMPSTSAVFTLPANATAVKVTVNGTPATVLTNNAGVVTMASPINQGADVSAMFDLTTSSGVVSDVSYSSVIGSSPYRQVASHCRIPEIYSTVSQILGESWHRAGQTLTSFAVEFAGWANAAGENNPEKIKTSDVNILTVLEYPPNSGNYQMLSYRRGPIGTLELGGVLRSDFLKLTEAIPKGAWFSLWHYHFTLSNSSGIPTVKGLPATKFGNTRGRAKLQGGITPVINYLTTQTPDYIRAITNTVAQGVDYITPAAIIAAPAADYDYAEGPIGILGDSRSVGSATPDKDDLLAGVAERLFCRNGRSFINFSASGQQFFQGFSPASNLDFNRRSHFLRYVDTIGNILGTNDKDRYTSVAAARDIELLLLNSPYMAGKRFEAATIPPYANASTDYYTSLAGQTMHPNNGNVANLNTYRKTNPDGLYKRVYDAASITTDAATGKWKVGPRARTLTVNMAAGSNTFDVVSGATLEAADNGVYSVFMAGAANAALAGVIEVVSPTQGKFWQADLLRKSTGVAQNAVAAMSGHNAYIDANHYAGDTIHDSVTAAIEQGEAADSILINFP